MDFINRNRWRIMCSLFIIWALIGVFPLSCYETDSMHIIAGCNNYLSTGGNLTPPAYSYAYDMQPLATIAVVGFKKVFAFLTCEQIYCLLTAICALFFAWGCVTFIRKITSFKKEYILLALLLIPETYACAYYPNSTTLAAAFYIWALIGLVDKKWVLSGLLLCIAPLFRIDILIVYPVIFPLLSARFNWKTSLFRSLIYAVCVASFVTVACLWMKANPLDTLLAYSGMNNTLAFAGDVKFAIFTFYTAIGIILIPIGLYLLAAEKKYRLLVICLLPAALLHYLFRNTGCATKHYLYLLPFAALAMTRALEWIAGLRHKCLKRAIAGCICLFLIGSVRIDIPESPWRNQKNSEACIGPVATLYREGVTPLKARFGLGAGQLIPTLDEFMLASGNAFYPFYIHHYKLRKDNYRKEAYKLLKDKNYKLLMLSWGEKSWFVNLLLEDGWRMSEEECPADDKLGKLMKGEKHIECFFTEEIRKNDYEGLSRVLKRHAKNKPVCVVEELENMAYLLDMASEKGEIEKLSDRCYIIR